MEQTIAASSLNDFVFCPMSLYFHGLYRDMDVMAYENTDQINGTNAHRSVDEGHYSTQKDILTGLEVYSEKYNLIGKIDMYNVKTKTLRERKKKIKQIYDGYIFQLYAQYFALNEMGYEVKRMELYSKDDNKIYLILLPEQDSEMYAKFKQLLIDMNGFNADDFIQTNSLKCKNCIYEPACDRSVAEDNNGK